METFILLIFGHALADFVLQSETMAKGKNRNRKVDPSVIPPGQKFQPSWFYWLTAHAATHGAAVYIVTGSLTLALLETGFHWLIDFGKCESWYGIHTDQAAHISCKLFWAIA